MGLETSHLIGGFMLLAALLLYLHWVRTLSSTSSQLEQMFYIANTILRSSVIYFYRYQANQRHPRNSERTSSCRSSPPSWRRSCFYMRKVMASVQALCFSNSSGQYPSSSSQLLRGLSTYAYRASVKRDR